MNSPETLLSAAPPPDEPIALPELCRLLEGTRFGKEIRYLASTPSTNAVARELGAGGCPEGLLVTAEHQTAGRGRLGREWHSPAYANLLFSLLLRPPLKPEDIFGVTMLLALAVCETLSDEGVPAAQIKWPNDIFLAGKKAGGLLTEIAARHAQVDYVVLGLGLNVAWRPELPSEALYPATSVWEVLGRPIPRTLLLGRIVKRFADYYDTFLKGRRDTFYRLWQERSMLLARPVAVRMDDALVTGIAEDIDAQGALILRDASGVRRRIVHGDASVRLRTPAEDDAFQRQGLSG